LINTAIAKKERQKVFSKHWYLRANLSAFLRTRTLGRTAPKKYWQSLTTCLSH